LSDFEAIILVMLIAVEQNRHNKDYYKLRSFISLERLM